MPDSATSLRFEKTKHPEHEAFDADAYYDSARAEAYSAEFAGAQRNLALVAGALAGYRVGRLFFSSWQT